MVIASDFQQVNTLSTRRIGACFIFLNLLLCISLRFFCDGTRVPITAKLLQTHEARQI